MLRLSKYPFSPNQNVLEMKIISSFPQKKIISRKKLREQRVESINMGDVDEA
jgi:hypothetical protein